MKAWLWAIPKESSDRIDERPLTSFPLDEKQIESVKTAAAKDGWHSFRTVQDDNLAPNFAGALNR